MAEAFTTINEANLSQKELEAQHKRKEFIYIQKSLFLTKKPSGISEGFLSVEEIISKK